SLADAVLLRTLPVREPHELVVLRLHGPGGDIFPFTSGAVLDLAEGRDVLSGLAAFRPLLNTHVTVGGRTELALAQLVSGTYHAVVGVPAAIGRTLTDSDREPVAVIGHRYWQQRFAGDPNVLGRTLDMQGRSFTIVGVTAKEFFGTQPGRDVDVTAPLAAGTMKLAPQARWLYLIGRLQPGVSREHARAALQVRWDASDASQSRPRPVTLEVDSGAQGLNELRRQFSTPLRILMAAVGLVLLVACANLAGLLIARSTGRQQEIAVRLSLGAARGRIVRQLLTESLVLAAVGGAAAFLLANVVTDLLVAMMSRGRTPIAIDVAPNLRTLAFTAVVTIVTAVLFGLLPAIGASRTNLQPSLKRHASGPDAARNRWARAMVAVQVALLMLLITCAALFARTLQNLRAVDAGFHREHVLLLGVSTGPSIRGAAARSLYDDLHARFSAIPSVRSVSMSMDAPLGGDLSMAAGIVVEGRQPDPHDTASVYHNFVGPRFFETMGIPILAGRDIESGDDGNRPTVVAISENVGRRYFPGEDPIGRRLLLGDAPATIVGVVKDVRYSSLRRDAPLMIYRPFRQANDAPAGAFLIRAAAADATLLAPSLFAAVRDAAPALPLPSIATFDDRLAGMLVEERMLATLSSALGILAAILASIGIYSAVASMVAARQREIGIRMALGARPRQAVRMVVGEAVTIVAGGLAAGVPAAIAAGWAAREFLSRLLFQLSPTDPPILAGSAIAILAVAFIAAYAPARRASRIDPVAAIKYE
ncbi:MAG TPA: ABC transporter permease, partial [Vicinamibacterales bacterium]